MCIILYETCTREHCPIIRAEKQALTSYTRTRFKYLLETISESTRTTKKPCVYFLNTCPDNRTHTHSGGPRKTLAQKTHTLYFTRDLPILITAESRAAPEERDLNKCMYVYSQSAQTPYGKRVRKCATLH